MAKRILRALVTVDIEVDDDDWTDEMVRENGIIYLNSMIDEGQRRTERLWGSGSYRFDTSNLTLFVPETDYLLDLADLSDLES